MNDSITTNKMGNKKRVKDGIKYGIIYTEIIMFLGIIVLNSYQIRGGNVMLIKKFTAALVSAVLLTAPQSFSFASGDMFAVSAASQEVNFDSFDMNVNGGDTIRGVDVSSIISVENSVPIFSRLLSSRLLW